MIDYACFPYIFFPGLPSYNFSSFISHHFKSSVVDLFLEVDITHCHRLDTEMYTPPALEAGNLNSRCQRDPAPSRSSRLDFILSASVVCWLHACSLCFHSHPASSSSICQISRVFLIRTLALGFKTHPGNPGWSHLKIFNLITSEKTLFPNKVTLTHSRDFVYPLEDDFYAFYITITLQDSWAHVFLFSHSYGEKSNWKLFCL